MKKMHETHFKLWSSYYFCKSNKYTHKKKELIIALIKCSKINKKCHLFYFIFILLKITFTFQINLKFKIK
jgi:hypothetical protein